jgi:hypothetical protein
VAAGIFFLVADCWCYEGSGVADCCVDLGLLITDCCVDLGC